jgi:hypothetical protein
MLYSGRRPGIKDDIGFQQGSNVKLNAPKRLSNFVKGKAPMVQDNEGYIYILLVIPNTKLGELMLRNLILFLTVLLCIRMRLLALGNQPMLNCLKRKLLLHQMILTFHLRLLMLLMCLLTNQAKYLPNMLGENTRGQRLVFGYPRCLFLTKREMCP